MLVHYYCLNITVFNVAIVSKLIAESLGRTSNRFFGEEFQGDAKDENERRRCCRASRFTTTGK